MLYRSLLGKNLPLNRALPTTMLQSAIPHRVGGVNTFSMGSGSLDDGLPIGSKFVVAGSPLFVTDLSKQFDFSEIQFVLSEQV